LDVRTRQRGAGEETEADEFDLGLVWFDEFEDFDELDDGNTDDDHALIG
jgi:hypothetical protein